MNTRNNVIDAHPPVSIGIIMDGNRRWARQRGLPTLEGHARGFEKFKEVAQWTRDAGVRALTCFAFSTENWSRSPEEVSYLMDLIERALLEDLERVIDEGARFILVGERERLPERAQGRIAELEARSRENATFTLAVAFSYGGRADIVQATNTLIKRGTPVTEAEISQALWTRDIPNPDMIIRTGGEKRLSGFLTWDSVYSELFFTDTFWPEFSKEEFVAMLEEYGRRERRNGK